MLCHITDSPIQEPDDLNYEYESWRDYQEQQADISDREENDIDE